jgi:hypothetical protein
LPETFPAPFTARRERRDEDGENDAHSIEIKFGFGNEIQDDQTNASCDQKSAGLVTREEMPQLNVSRKTN